MIKQKITGESSLSRIVKLGKGIYMKTPNTPILLQPIAMQNSIKEITATTYKSYKTS